MVMAVHHGDIVLCVERRQRKQDKNSLPKEAKFPAAQCKPPYHYACCLLYDKIAYAGTSTENLLAGIRPTF